jgi:hypothetical protein
LAWKIEGYKFIPEVKIPANASVTVSLAEAKGKNVRLNLK